VIEVRSVSNDHPQLELESPAIEIEVAFSFLRRQEGIEDDADSHSYGFFLRRQKVFPRDLRDECSRTQRDQVPRPGRMDHRFLKAVSSHSRCDKSHRMRRSRAVLVAVASGSVREGHQSDECLNRCIAH
jgi:hypothetical protein